MLPITKQPVPIYLSAAVLILGLLGVLGTYQRGPAPQLPLDTWEVDDFVSHLRGKGLEFCVVPNYENGPLKGGAYLTTTDKTRGQLLTLPAVPEQIEEWKGTISINRVARFSTNGKLSWLSGGCYARVGDFILFGDPQLRDTIEDALRAAPRDLHRAGEKVPADEKMVGFLSLFVRGVDGLR